VGIEEFETHEPTFSVAMADGRVGMARTRIAFSVGRPTTIELIEPVEGLVDCYADALRRADGSSIAFHHVGVMVDDLDVMKRAAAGEGLHPVVQSGRGDEVHWVFFSPRQLDHYVELMEAGDWIKSLQSRSLPATP
jgi:hypothetical protein